MKRLLTILAFLLLAAPAHADESVQLARMSGPMLGAGSAAAGCSESVNEINSDRDTASFTNYTQTADMALCWLDTADCSGTLSTAYIYHVGTGGNAVKVCVYTEGDSDTVADSSDTLMGCADITTGTNNYASASMTGSSLSVVQGSSYWLCVFPTAATNETRRGERAVDVYGLAESGYYASTPSDISGIAYLASFYPLNAYVTIGP